MRSTLSFPCKLIDLFYCYHILASILSVTHVLAISLLRPIFFHLQFSMPFFLFPAFACSLLSFSHCDRCDVCIAIVTEIETAGENDCVAILTKACTTLKLNCSDFVKVRELTARVFALR